MPIHDFHGGSRLGPGRKGLGVKVDRDEDWVDPIIGARYGFEMFDKWHLRLYGDIGGFGIESDHALNAEAMLRYRFGRMFSLKFGYRYLKVEFQDNELVYDASLAGFLLGLGIRF